MHMRVTLEKGGNAAYGGELAQRRTGGQLEKKESASRDDAVVPDWPHAVCGGMRRARAAYSWLKVARHTRSTLETLLVELLSTYLQVHTGAQPAHRQAGSRGKSGSASSLLECIKLCIRHIVRIPGSL